MDRAWKGSFDEFCGLLDIIPKSGTRSKLRLNPIQRRYCAARSPRDIVLKPRQIGLTTLELARDVWIFLTRPGARVVVTCQSLTDHGPLKQLSTAIRTMLDGLRREGIDLQFRVEALAEWVLADRDASLRIVEAGASEAAAEKKGRSGTITRLHLTETAFYEYAQQTLNAMLECVPGPEYGSEVVSESTANGAAGFFYEQYESASKGRGAYRAHFFPWFEQPEYRAALEPGEVIIAETDRERELVRRFNVSVEQLKWYRGKVVDKGQDLVDQEYPTDPETCWLISGRLFFDVGRTKALIASSRDPIEAKEVGREGSRGTLRVWQKPERDRGYVIAIDPSEGTGGDPGAAVVYDRESGEHVATVHGQFAPWELARIGAEVGLEYNRALLIVERNNHGRSVLDALTQSIRYGNVYVDRDKKHGWNNTSSSRPAALDALFDAHREKRWSSPDRTSLSEMLTFVVKDDGKAEAAKGAHDDLVIAHAIAWLVVSRPVGASTVGVGAVTSRFGGGTRGF